MIDQLGIAKLNRLAVTKLGPLNAPIVDKRSAHAHILDLKCTPVTGQHGMLRGNIGIR